MEQVDKLMKQALHDSVFPGGALLVSKQGSVVFFEAYGYANIFSKCKMTKDTIFDLASLTKPLATTLAIIMLIQQGKLDIEQSIGHVLPVFKKTEKEQIKIKHLLTHNSGYPDHRPYYDQLRLLPADTRKSALREFLVKEPLVYSTGDKTIYSDLGFMVLEWIIETVSGKRLDHFADENIYKPLGLENFFFVETSEFKGTSEIQKFQGKFAATELCPWRNILLEGQVHDDNAYAAGGIQGHAGLFGTAGDVCILLSELLADFYGHSSKGLFNKDILKIFFEQQGNTGRTLGFDLPSPSKSASGSYFSKKTAGHLGFTGTSFWMDLERNIYVILLTNRVHPSRNNIKIKAFRPKLHDAVMKIIAT
ncbi:MAG: serine hydrolase [Desulfobacterales bacterium]|nr:serine hydrolase [Desulfobacterales bacterium]